MRFPKRPPELAQLLSKNRNIRQLVLQMSPVLADGRYLHWDDLIARKPPTGMSHEDWWAALKLARNAARVPIPSFTDVHGQNFWFCRLDAIDRATHRLDRRDAARELLESIGDDSARTQYRVDQLIEEAINSSLIEGAKLTTRAQAQAMLREERAPMSKGERMVANNYDAMQRLLGLKDRELEADDLLEIHATLGAGSLDQPGIEGRFRTPKDRVRIEDGRGDVWFTPPAAEQVSAHISAMLAFANKRADAPFIHPLVRAIALHFWLAYIHPFADGNGRMARALFYWQMLRSGYDFAQYLSISGPIDRSPRAYYRAFALTETDGADLTYFLLHQLSVLEKATDELIAHLRERGRQLQALPQSPAIQALNRRQQALVAALRQRPESDVTVTGHARSHGVSYLTARKDLQDMEKSGLLQRNRSGTTDRYSMSRTLARQLRQR